MVLVYLVPGNMGYQVRVRYCTPWNFVLFNICTAAFPMNKKKQKTIPFVRDKYELLWLIKRALHCVKKATGQGI